MSTCWDYFQNNVDRPITKWSQYFPIYERYFNSFINKSVNVLEIGVFKGGSLQMWKNYFGPLSNIVGLDIDQRCKEFEEPQINIRIGDQRNAKVLNKLVEEFGNFDIIIDDGSHIMEDVIESFKTLFPKLNNNGIYLIEDMHTSYWENHYNGGYKKSSTVIEYSKNLIDTLNREHFQNNLEKNDIYSISFFDSVIVFEKKKLYSKNMSIQSEGV